MRRLVAADSEYSAELKEILDALNGFDSQISTIRHARFIFIYLWRAAEFI
jgi:hypothetical protein